MQRLREKYEKEVVPAMFKEFGYKSIMAVPKLRKVVLNMGVGGGHLQHQSPRQERGRTDAHCGAESGDHEGKEVHCRVQASGRHAHRLHRDLAARKDV